MEEILFTLEKGNEAIRNFVWGFGMVAILIGTGVYFTVFTGFLQVRKFKMLIKTTIGSLSFERTDSNTISPFQAVCTALAGTIGTGNIAGVATAIAAGGAGAVFWVMVGGFFSAMTKYAEVVLAVHFRDQNEKGENIGGPMYYIEKGLGMKWLALLFAVFCTFASFGIGNMAQSNSIAVAVHASFGISPLWTGIIVAFIVGLVIIGGIKRIATISEKFIPIMSILYTLCCFIVIVTNYKVFFDVVILIFRSAFCTSAVVGGAAGFTVMQTIRHSISLGIFSNEAGLGSASIAHAATNETEPAKQGLWGVFEVFVDTLVVVITGFVLLTAGNGQLWLSIVKDGTLQGAAFTSAAFSSAMGSFGSIFLAVSIIVFAFSSMIGWSYYGEKALEYLAKGNDRLIFAYRMVFIGCIICGATMQLKLVWGICETLNGLMAIPNILALLFLSPIVLKSIKKISSNY